jgi:hypothetical protein
VACSGDDLEPGDAFGQGAGDLFGGGDGVTGSSSPTETSVGESTRRS